MTSVSAGHGEKERGSERERGERGTMREGEREEERERGEREMETE